uniref:fibronectin type III domain-containing protein n=1 Tax=Levilactobacillus wangkuiensis TaxID=2799566 RepID=UPI001951D0C2
IVSSTVQYRNSGDTDWTNIQSAVTTLSGHVSGLTGNSEYEFRAFVTNYVGDSPYSSTQTVKTMDDRIFGASWDMSSDPKLTRTDAAVGLVAGINGAQNDFDTVGPWAKMDKTITDDKGNAFVRIPKLYIKKTQTDKLATWQVSLSKIDDSWYLPKCFWDFTNQKELDYVDVGRYQGTVTGGLLQSKSGVTATDSLTIGSFRADAKANGDGYQLLDIHVVDVWQVLFLIEFATLDSQSIIHGNLDNGSSGSAKTNGTGSNHAGSSGYATSTGPMDYRGIENMYGNLYQWTDGVNLTGANAWVCDDANKYQSDLFAAPYQALSYTTATGWISKMGYDSNHPFAQFATVASGSASTYYADYQYTTTGNTVAAYGGYWYGAGSYGGAFYWGLDNSSTSSSVYRGSRLVKKALG